MRVGVVSFQGSFARHRVALGRLGVHVTFLRRPEDLGGIDHVVLPGGESTVIGQFLYSTGLGPEIASRFREGSLAVLGTCAGAILLGQAPKPTEPQPDPAERTPREPIRLAVCETVVARNAYGRQIDSFRADLEVSDTFEAPETPLPGAFIRAPRFGSLSAAASVLATHDAEPVLVREGRALLCAFHPELTDDLRVHRLFLSM